jgi:hypothetical protein
MGISPRLRATRKQFTDLQEHRPLLTRYCSITPRDATPILSRVVFFTTYIISSAWRMMSCGVWASCGKLARPMLARTFRFRPRFKIRFWEGHGFSRAAKTRQEMRASAPGGRLSQPSKGFLKPVLASREFPPPWARVNGRPASSVIQTQPMERADGFPESDAEQRSAPEFALTYCRQYFHSHA